MLNNRLILSLIFVLTFPLYAQKSSIQGRIFDKSTNRPLGFTAITNDKNNKGDIADSVGYYVMHLECGTTYTIKAQMAGYTTQIKQVYLACEQTSIINFYMQQKVYQGETVTVTDVQQKSTGGPFQVAINPKQLTKLPSLAESDILRAVQTLPGIVSSSDFSSQLFVRGSPSDHTLITYDGVPIWSPYHLGGLFSIFNSDGVAKLQFSPGMNHSSEGGRLAGYLNIVPRPMGTHEQKKVSLGLLSSKFSIEKKLTSGHYFISGRRTYLDLLGAIIANEPGGYYFYDIQFGFSKSIGKKHQLSAQSFYSKDLIEEGVFEDDGPIERPQWGNRVLSIRWNYIANQKLSVSSQFAFSDASIYGKTDDVWVDNSMGSLSLSTNIHFTNNQFEGRAGVTVEKQNFRYHWDLKEDNDLYDIVDDPPDIFFDNAPNAYQMNNNSWLVHTYLHEDIQLTPLSLISFGLRFSWHELSQSYSYEPRLTWKYRLLQNLQIYASYNHQKQHVYTLKTLNNEELFSPFSIYFPIEQEKSPLHARTINTGLDYQYDENINFGLEVYDKNMKKIPMVDPTTKQLDILPMHARGLDLFMEKRSGLLQYMVGYSLSQSRVQAKDFSYPSSHDRRHTVKLMTSFEQVKGWRTTIFWTLTSGLPYTAVIGKYITTFTGSNFLNHEDNDASVMNPIWGKHNAARYKAYHRLDVSFSKSWSYSNSQFRISFDILNLYHNQNPLFYERDFSLYDPKKKQVNNLPILPTLNLQYQF